MKRDVLTRHRADPYTDFDFPRGVAQSVARGVWDAEVGGSSPLTPTRDDARAMISPTPSATAHTGGRDTACRVLLGKTHSQVRLPVDHRRHLWRVPHLTFARFPVFL
jgi:hypothetical protein